MMNPCFYNIRRLVAAALVAVGVSARPAGAAPEEAARQRLRRTPVVEVFQRSQDAVVNIASTRIVKVRSGFGGPLDELFDLHPGRPGRRMKQTSVGSGFVIHEAGYVVTNAHVVVRTADRKVVFADGSEHEAEIVAVDPEHDLAMLKIETERPLPALPLGQSDDLMIGETVIAIGNPLGYQHTVTAGVISALDRELKAGPVRFEGLVQTDASINPGNSGGPLLNVLGELVGVNTAIRADAQNIGFAIPVDRLRAVLPEMLDVHRRYGLVTGLTIETVDDGCEVVEVAEDSPAASLGLEAGDRLTAVDGRRLRHRIDWHIALVGRRPGDRLRLTVNG
ncbi:MAG: trypsin-like peptidase domain-containing protein, partial [Phycisphaeraceae bacterium]|nr:trypsin-like peptidase domain-containing protein [Phycisphaeraceae bacterium]